jgi:hypothetical protein
MALKEDLTVYVSGSAVVDYVANADFTTDAIEWADFRGFTLNVWYSNLVGANPKPKITFQVSNSDDVNSFTDYNNYIDFRLPASFKKNNIEYKYIRFVYDSTGVDALSTITFELNKNTL